MTEDTESETNKSDDKKRSNNTHHAWDYGRNFLAFLLTQVIGNGITSLNTVMWLFGLGIHSGSHWEHGHLLLVSWEQPNKKSQQNTA